MTIPVCEDAGGRRADVSGSDTDSLVESDGDEHVHGSVASGEDDDIELPIVEPVAPGFTQLDQWDVDDILSHRASVMKTVPRFLRGLSTSL